MLHIINNLITKMDLWRN